MKSIFAACALLFVAASPALAADETLKVSNRTGYTINEIYIAPHSSDNWEEDVMGEDALVTNTSVDIDFSKSEDTCKWDLKAVYDDKTTAVWTNIDLCKISSITLFYNADTDVTSARYE
ncbi:argininosuccinate lyase [Sphingomonas sp. M1-B02]|uniref:argininosuccinate lyase n=1 Tax=Sphingomonas sp. M1-B02 TaxID=3114300 RepID=UPI00223E9CC9|nr:argininosuccinate lyase [Sphingomonas sp. S6-11]UZK66388.1 argininosuccinate lyase [Sphingomonas sp. S6-11]